MSAFAGSESDVKIPSCARQSLGVSALAAVARSLGSSSSGSSGTSRNESTALTPNDSSQPLARLSRNSASAKPAFSTTVWNRPRDDSARSRTS
ncbi:hypothetical protein GGTG_02351 [Gaeumannomyces tritici R3-111a-1]|uniref:Uncharacterized protein n=1 Tax=Gaeumannomyces tritici (strain R3-111a-1) TaxID=644352 RepID=J3NM47_GAET3|nr:hypothetical protein GGTG_02351 [Gaeumannomyces tritici R3-111a-1]EJT82378.1 hypothetical protein GGTG_02351 [Gaeumannomyces tritici R3-111a-1]